MNIAKKINKQNGLFLLLFVPFIILIIVHFLVPTIMLFNGFPFVQELFKNASVQNQAINTISLAKTNSKKLQTRIINLEEQLNNIQTILQSGGRFNSMKNNQKSSYSFFNCHVADKTQGKITISSNWFSNNFSQKIQFTKQLTQINDLYKKKQPLIIPSLATLMTQQVTNFITYYKKTNNSIIYNLQADNNSLKFQKYSKIFQILDFHQTQAIKKVIDRLDSDERHLSMCKSIGLFSLSQASIICLRINIENLLKKYNRQIENPKFPEGKYKIFIYELENIAIYNHSTETLQFMSNFEEIQKLIKKQQLQGYLNGNDSQIFWGQSQQNIFHLSLEQNSQKTPQFIVMGKYDKLVSLGKLQQNLNLAQLITPIVTIFVLFFILTYCILIKILQNIQFELNQLAKSLDYVLQGDIHVEIPDFIGTECISQLYKHAKTINILHRYSTGSYFTGHLCQKLLKYNQALHFLKKLNYDTGYVLENMGEAYNWIQEWDKSIDTLKQSIDIILNQIKSHYGPLDKVLFDKKNNKLPNKYKYLQNILLRRLFKLNFNLMKSLQFNGLHVKDPNSLISPEQIKRKTQVWMEDSAYYLKLQNNFLYPDLSLCAQSIVAHFNQAKQCANLKRFSEALKFFEKTSKLLKNYQKMYGQITVKLKEKGSKYKLFHMKHRLTSQSRLSPQLLKNALQVFQGRALNIIYSKHQKILQSFELLTTGFRCGSVIALCFYLGVMQVRKIITQLKINQEKFESTQIFRQAAPFKTLHYGEITIQNAAQLYKCQVADSQGLERQFMIVADCNISPLKEKESQQLAYSLQRLIYIYDKLIKSTDRLSLTKFTSKNGSKIQFNLTFKESSEILLRNELNKVYDNIQAQRSYDKNIFDPIMRSIWRIRLLKNEKIVIVFLKSIKYYTYREELRRKKLQKRAKQRSNINRYKNTDTIPIEDQCKLFGQLLINQMKDPQLRNCKVIIYCSKEDSVHQLRDFFDLQDINKRIWQQQNYINHRNVMVYVIQHKHKLDIDRILKTKAIIVADNNVCIL